MRRANLHIHPAVAADHQALSGPLGAERLIGLGFRHWVAGYKSGDIDRWEDAWRISRRR